MCEMHEKCNILYLSEGVKIFFLRQLSFCIQCWKNIIIPLKRWFSHRKTGQVSFYVSSQFIQFHMHAFDMLFLYISSFPPSLCGLIDTPAAVVLFLMVHFQL